MDTTYDVIISHLYQASETSYNVLFIDYNNDGDFTDANEIAYSGTDLSFSITTPSIAVVENELLRARLSVQIYSTSNNPCYQPNQNLAQIEDYGVYFLNSSTFGNVETSELTFSVSLVSCNRSFFSKSFISNNLGMGIKQRPNCD